MCACVSLIEWFLIANSDYSTVIDSDKVIGKFLVLSSEWMNVIMLKFIKEYSLSKKKELSINYLVWISVP